MAENIKGITIEFRGNATPLQKAIREVNSELHKTTNDLKGVNRALKFNPSNVDLWRQKQALLEDKVKETKDKLDALKQAQAQMDAAGVDKNSDQYRKLQHEIIETEGKLKQFKSELRSIGDADLHAIGEKFKEIGSKAEEAGEKMSKTVTAPIAAIYAAGAKAALSYGDAIAKMSTLADETQVPVEQLKAEILALSNASGIGATELAEAAYQAMSASVETKDVMAFLSDAKDLAKVGFLDTADAVDVLTTIINAYGMEAKDAALISNQLIQTQNDGKTTVNELAASMGQVIPTAAALNVPLEQLNAAYAILTKNGTNAAKSSTYLNGMFSELSDYGSEVATILQDQTGKTFGQLMAEGSTLGDILGILSQTVDGDGEAFKNLWGNARAGTAALSLLNSGVDEFNAEAAAMSESSGNIEAGLEKLQTPGAAARKALNEIVNAGIAVGDVLAPYIQKGATFIQGLVDKFNNLSPGVQNFIVKVGLVIAAIGPALVIFGKLSSGIGTIIQLFGMVAPAIAPVLATIAPLIVIIGLLVAAGIALYKNWDSIKERASAFAATVRSDFNAIKSIVSGVVSAVISKFNTLKSRVAAIWNGIKDAITHPLQTAKAIVSAAINKIKSIINGAKLSLPKFKLPHFKISGGTLPWGIGGKGTAPKINVEWYRKAENDPYMFSSPTLFGAGEGRKDEMLYGHSALMEDIKNAVGGSSPVITFNVTVNGADNPEEWARRLARQMQLEMRMM